MKRSYMKTIKASGDTGLVLKVLKNQLSTNYKRRMEKETIKVRLNK